MDAASPGEENYELEEIPQEHTKQQLADTYITLTPKNTAGYTTKGTVVTVQIPKTEHVLCLSKSFIYLDLKIGICSDGEDYEAPDDTDVYVGMINAATIFDMIQIKNNGKDILSDTFCQVNSRIWQMTKSSEYLKGEHASFINIDDITANEGFIMQKLTPEKFTADTTVPVTYKLKIPLPCLFNCFDNASNFSTSDLNDDVTLSMKLSAPSRYMCLVKADSATHRVLSIEPFDISAQAAYYYG